MDQNNNAFTELEKNVELLMNAFNNILFLTPEELVVTPTRNNLSEINSCLNRIFPENKCIDVVYTNNYDKLYFGIRVNPQIDSVQLTNIIANEDKMKLNAYKIEFDSKLFNMGLSPQELAAYTIYEVASMCNSYQIIDDLRTVIDLNMASNDDTIYLKESTYYAQLIIYAIKDALTKLSSLIYKDDIEEYVTNPIIQALDLGEFLVSAHDTIISSESGPKDSQRACNTSILQWMFIMYRDMRTNSSTVMDTLKDAKTTTGSKLDIEEINKTIDAINRIDAKIAPQTEALELPKFFEAMNISAVNEFSLFSGLKKNGLRSIEDYLYEVALRIKNLETEEDAVYVMRSISTRMNILADYIYNTPGLSDAERRHWEQVYDRYSKLREELVKKRIWNKKQYGLFFDYNQDFGDKPYEESADQPMDSNDEMTEKVKDAYEKLAGDSSKWNKVTQPDIDISEEEIEAELESIQFDENGEVVTEGFKLGDAFRDFAKKIGCKITKTIKAGSKVGDAAAKYEEEKKKTEEANKKAWEAKVAAWNFTDDEKSKFSKMQEDFNKICAKYFKSKLLSKYASYEILSSIEDAYSEKDNTVDIGIVQFTEEAYDLFIDDEDDDAEKFGKEFTETVDKIQKDLDKKYKDVYVIVFDGARAYYYISRPSIVKESCEDCEDSDKVCTDPACVDANDEKVENYEEVKSDGNCVDCKIDSDPDTEDVIKVPDSVDISIPDDINESVLFGSDEQGKYIVNEFKPTNQFKKIIDDKVKNGQVTKLDDLDGDDGVTISKDDDDRKPIEPMKILVYDEANEAAAAKLKELRSKMPVQENLVDDIKKKATDLNELRKEWAQYAKSWVNNKWIYRYIKDEKQEELLKKHYKNLTDTDVSYGDYKKSFAYIANFFGLPKEEIIIEWLEFEKSKNPNEPDRVALRYSKGLHKVKIPKDVQLIHVSPVDGINNLEPAFRSKTKGKFMYPSKRCFFTVGKAINPFKMGTADTLWTPSKVKLHKYVTKSDVGEAYIDPTYTSIKDGSVMIITEKPIPVMKFEDKMKKLFEKFKGKKSEDKKEEPVKEDTEEIQEASTITNRKSLHKQAMTETKVAINKLKSKYPTINKAFEIVDKNSIWADDNEDFIAGDTDELYLVSCDAWKFSENARDLDENKKFYDAIESLVATLNKKLKKYGEVQYDGDWDDVTITLITNEALDEATEFDDDIEVVDEFFGFGKKKQQKEASYVKKYAETPEQKEIISYLDKTYKDDIIKIVEDEYNKNKAKWDKLAIDLSKEAIAKGEDGFDEDDYAEFQIRMDDGFSLHRGYYHLTGEFFIADQILGFTIEEKLEKAFFAAIQPKIKKVLGPLFKEIQGDPDDCPGVFSVVVKCDKSQIQESVEAIDEFKADIKQAYDSRLRAEKKTNQHNKDYVKGELRNSKGDMLYGKGHHKTEIELDNDFNEKSTKLAPSHDTLENGLKAVGVDTNSPQAQKSIALNKTVKTKADKDARDKAMSESSWSLDDELFDSSILEEDTSWYDADIQELVESFEYDEDAITEGAISDFLQTIKSWKTSNEAHSKKVFKSSSLTDEEYDAVKGYLDEMKREDVKYGDYKKAFNKFCAFCHIVPTGTIITKYNLKKGKNGNDNSLEVEYSENTKKIQLPDGIKLFHISKVPNISALIPQFKGKSERGYLYDRPRVYFTINKYMPKFLADYKSTDKLHKYECKKDIKDVYVDPLVWNVSQGAVYVETDSDIPVKEVKMSEDVKSALDKVNPLSKSSDGKKETEE